MDSGIPRKFIVSSVQAAQVQSYGYVAGITVVVHDAVLLYRKEVQHIYRGGWSSVKVIYILIRLFAFLDFILFLYVTLKPSVPSSVCKAVTWVTGFTRYIGYTCVIKTLLVMRLRALYGNNAKVTALLCLAMAVEVLSAVYYALLTSISTQIFGTLDLTGTPGCRLATLEHIAIISDQAASVLWAARLFSNTLEVALTLGKLYTSLGSSQGILSWKLERIKHWRPILYVFYRDGTMFFVPMFVLSLLGLLNSTHIFESTTTWSMWLSLVYCTCGTRLILNLRIANCKLLESTVAHQISTIQFNHQSAPQAGAADDDNDGDDTSQPSIETYDVSTKPEDAA